MPQLIAMVIVVVGAMIYMFQTFGGTGDKIEGVAQKSSIITEINNIKDGLKIAAKSEHIEDEADDATDAVATLEGLARMAYFAEQINEQLVNSDDNPAAKNDDYNIYKAISFGGDDTTTAGQMEISLANHGTGYIPGIFIKFNGALKDNAAFLEAQIENDLKAVAKIDRYSTSTNMTGSDADAAATGIDKRLPQDNASDGVGTTSDGMFTVYFKDFASDEVIK